MVNRTAWTGGNLNTGLSWTGLFSSSDINLMSPGQSVRSSLGDITNGTGLDMFMDVSLKIVFSQTTATGITAGSNVALYLMPLLQDGTTYGDGSIPTAGAGGFTTIVPSIPPAAIFTCRTGGSQTFFGGFAQAILIPPGSFQCALVNNFAISFGGSQACYFRSYNIQLNN